jgi:hypothetical protein
VSRSDPLAAHVRRLGNQELNELLVQLPKPTFAALVDVALARPVLPAGLLLRYEAAPGVDGWTVVTTRPRSREQIHNRACGRRRTPPHGCARSLGALARPGQRRTAAPLVLASPGCAVISYSCRHG